MNGAPPKDLIRAARAANELAMRAERERHQNPEGGLIEFVRSFWSVLEPSIPLIEGWCLDAMCEHLEAVTDGSIKRLLINVSPGSMKSLLVNVFFPAWLWGPMDYPDARFVSFSYSAHLTERDNERFRDVVLSQKYRRMYGRKLLLTGEGKVKVANNKTGWKFASSVGGVGTGERGDFVLLDDPHNVKEAESETVRNDTVRWFRESMQNRLNDLDNGVIIVIMQRVNEYDVSGCIIENYLDYVHLCIPMEYDGRDVVGGRKIGTSIGWADPRTAIGELAWPERFSEASLAPFRNLPYLWAGQYQQTPEPRGGGIIKRDYWNIWDHAAMARNDVKMGAFPPFEFVLASYDGAYTEKEENDPSALTIWGLWMEGMGPEADVGDPGNPKFMLIHAWEKRLTINGRSAPAQFRGETDIEYSIRRRENWGIVEHIAESCRKFKVDKLLIEGKANGISVYQEMQRLFSREKWSTQIVRPDGMDKVARAYTVVDMFTDGMIWRPDTEWAQKVEDQCVVTGTLIITDRGVVPVEDVGVGDMVLTHEGRFRPVTRVSCRIAHETITVEAKALDSLTLTPDHPYYAAKLTMLRKVKEISWVPAKAMIARDYRPTARAGAIVMQAYPSECHAALLPVIQRETPIDHIDLRQWLQSCVARKHEVVEGHGFISTTNPKSGAFRYMQPLDYDFGWMVGFYLAEGCSRRACMDWSLNSKTEMHVAERLAEIIRRKFGVKARIIVNGAVVSVRTSMSILVDFFKDCGAYAHEKRIPHWMWDAPDECLQAMVDGYIEGDGCERPDHVIATSVSPSLVWGIRLACLRLGINANVRMSRQAREVVSIEGRKCKTRDAYAVSWRKDKKNNGSALFIENAAAYSVMKKSEGPRGVEVYNFDVLEDHSYCTTGGLVHNCASFPKGNHDDLVDTVTYALRTLRRMGIAPRSEESRERVMEMLYPSRPRAKKLYEV